MARPRIYIAHARGLEDREARLALVGRLERGEGDDLDRLPGASLPGPLELRLGPGRVVGMMRSWSTVFDRMLDGHAATLMPPRALLDARIRAVDCQRLGKVIDKPEVLALVADGAYREQIAVVLAEADLRPGALAAFRLGGRLTRDGLAWSKAGLLEDGDTLLCSCGGGVPHGCADGVGHREAVIAALRKAGWRVEA